MSNWKLFSSHIGSQIIINYLTCHFIIGEEQAMFQHQVCVEEREWAALAYFCLSPEVPRLHICSGTLQ